MLDRSLNTAPAPIFPRGDATPVEWAVSPGLTPYPKALAFMEARALAIAEGRAGELVWLVEHPPLYTAGVSAKDGDLLDAARFPIFQAGRGGQYTYHGPGQRVVYVMLDLSRRKKDVRAFVAALEAWLIAALEPLGVAGLIRPCRVGVWVERGPREDKIAAIGVKLRRWVTFHGISLNVAPDLSHYDGIVPCGQTVHGVTSLLDLGVSASLEDVDEALRRAFVETFGPVTRVAEPD